MNAAIKEKDYVQVIGVIDATPTWKAMLPLMLQARDNIKAQIESKPFHTPAQRESLKTIEDEFLRMAEIADAYVAKQKAEKEGKREALLADNKTNFDMGVITKEQYEENIIKFTNQFK